jgi:hypothetical protein
MLSCCDAVMLSCCHAVMLSVVEHASWHGIAWFDWLSSLTDPVVVDDRIDQVGTIPESYFTYWPYMFNFDLSHNLLTGTLPAALPRTPVPLYILSTLRFNNNQFTGMTVCHFVALYRCIHVLLYRCSTSS